jgi:putative transcriptional regulator
MDNNNNELDKFKWNYKKEIRKKLRIGSLILSQPFLKDELFKRSVCLLCAHSREEGSFGFILNKKTEYLAGDFIEEFEGLPIPVFYGGPVANDSLYFIHDNVMQLEGAHEICKGVFWGGDFHEMIRNMLIATNMQTKIKFVLGYSGWDPGQLRKEIIEDSWIVANGSKDIVFSESEDLWKEVMQEMGGLYDHLSKLPERPELN